ncbi:gephyrin-like molybdotransferase receptor GlpR [Streptomyces sp. M41]|uniref:divisome protein SepX/GlpR n=1 Tax=Streptomyces sp. M41 TaxID=3059412 RepID=UPI00374CCA00
MSSSGLIYAVIVGAWAAYLVPMWLRRQDELNEARPTERFSTAIRLLSGRAGMERRYAKDLRARSTDEGEPSADDPGDVTESVDVRAFAVPPTRPQTQAAVQAQASEPGSEPAPERGGAHAPDQSPGPARNERKRVPAARRAPSSEAAAARARRTKVLARRRRTTMMLFLAFTAGAIVAAIGGLAFLWAPGVPAVLLSGYIAYLRSQERRRFAYQMDRRQAEAAAQRLREHARSRRRGPADGGDGGDETDEGPEPGTETGLSALAADRRALVEQTDHAEWVDQQRERQRRPGHGDSWDPVPVPLPTYVTAPVAPRATADVDLGAPDAWSSARSSAVAHDRETGVDAGDGTARGAGPADAAGGEERPPGSGRTDALPQARNRSRGANPSAASARRARERGRTPLFDQYEDGDRPRAANE